MARDMDRLGIGAAGERAVQWDIVRVLAQPLSTAGHDPIESMTRMIRFRGSRISERHRRHKRGAVVHDPSWKKVAA